MKKLKVNQVARRDTKGGLFASHPNLADRILKVRNTETSVLKKAIFEGITEAGEVAATIALQMQRYYPERPGADEGYELIGFVDTTPALRQKTKIKALHQKIEKVETKRAAGAALTRFLA